MSPLLLIITGTDRDGLRTIIDIRGRTINQSSLHPLAWGRDAPFEERVETAKTVIYHSGCRWPGIQACEAFAIDVVVQFPDSGWSITDTQVAAWLARFHSSSPNA